MARARVHLDSKLFYGAVLPAWERSFGVRLEPDDFARAATVGDIWAVVERHVVARIGENPTGLTLAGATQHTFYCLRRALVAQGQARAAVAPRTQLRTVLPWRQRQRRWRDLEHRTALTLPRLQQPALLFAACWAVGTALGWGLQLGGGLALINGLAAAVVVGQLPWLRWGLPAQTLGELAAKVVASNYKTLSHPYVRHNLGEMRDAVLADLAGCEVASQETAPDELYDGTKLAW